MLELERRRISIHTPYAGSDRCIVTYEGEEFAFQSTLPMQGVTSTTTRNYIQSLISIHTPYAGSDLETPEEIGMLKVFQSTLPMQGVTSGGSSPSGGLVFQSTLPMQGVTQSDLYTRPVCYISIHTPYAGSDHGPAAGKGANEDFNPHSLCRE